MPYRRKPVAKPPSSRYLSADSCERGTLRANPERTYSEIESSSMPRKIVIRLVAAASSIMPAVAPSRRM